MAPSVCVPPWVKLGIHDAGLEPGSNLPRGVSLTTAMRLSHVRVRNYLREMGIADALFAAAVATPFESFKLLQRDDIVRFGMDRREFGEAEWRFFDEPAPKIMKLFFVRTDGDEPHYVDGVVEIGCNTGRGMYLILARQQLGSDTDSSGAGSTAVTHRHQRQTGRHEPKASAGYYVRTGLMVTSAFDTVGDKATIELPGSELGRKKLGNVTLTLDGFSAAYAKLQSRCSHGALRRHRPPARLHWATKWGTLPDALAASPNSRHCGIRRSNSRASPLPSKSPSWIFYIRSCWVVRPPAS